LTDPEIELGRVAYDGYLSASGGKSLVSGAPLPSFEEQPAEIKAAWIAAANAVCKRFGAIY
jgi:hypothetical protein